MPSSRGDSIVNSFPGHYCPGLIEAYNIYFIKNNCKQAFRGITAPASLKQNLYGKDIWNRQAFRGITAPASLKPALGGGQRRRLVPFRGITAPASLKPDAPGPQAATMEFFPGHYCPGLIEAP